jgi:uncharacterized protein (TIGR03086 family)
VDVINRLERSINQTRPIIAATTPDQLGLQTPCTEWKVKDLLNHAIGALVMFRDAADKGEADFAAMGADHVASGAADAFDQASKETLEALRAKGTDGTIKLPFGELPCEFAYQLIADDILVHGWDLATATGQRVAWDQGLAEETLTFARAGLADPAIRGAEFAAPAACPDGADPMTQLAAFLGRTV